MEILAYLPVDKTKDVKRNFEKLQLGDRTLRHFARWLSANLSNNDGDFEDVVDVMVGVDSEAVDSRRRLLSKTIPW